MNNPPAIRVDCPDCGYIWVAPDRITVRKCNVPARSYFEFFCHRCESTVMRRIDPCAVNGFETRGALIEEWVIAPEALEEHDGPPISLDDLIDLHQALLNFTGFLPAPDQAP